MQVMHFDAVFRDVIAILVGLTVAAARVDSTSGHPHRKAARMMVSAVDFFG